MSNPLSIFLKKKVLRKNQNLVSIEEPFAVMKKVLERQTVTGILDAGASNGSVSKRLLQSFPGATVYGFEPNPLYRETLEQFSASEPRFRPNFKALSDTQGEVELNFMASPGISSMFAPNERLRDYDAVGSQVKTSQKISTIPIDDWAREQGVKGLEVMKFDIQGAELMALNGARETLTHSTLLVYTEIWFNPCYDGGALFWEVDQLLRECGFVLYELFQPKYHQSGLLFWGNAMYLHAGRMGY